MELKVLIPTLEERFCSQMYFLVDRSNIVNIFVEEEDAFHFKIFISSFLESLSNFIAVFFLSPS